MNALATVYLTGFGLVLIWALFYFGIRPYRLDLVRHKLFVLRDELFMFAADGGISFDDPAYFKLRNRINALIRYAHTINLVRLLILVTHKDFERNPAFARAQREWEAARNNAPAGAAREKINQINSRVATTLAWHVVTGVPPLYVVVKLPSLLGGGFSFRESENAKTNAVKSLRIELIEEEAVLAQRQQAEFECEMAHA
jgi:hypothetical protein